MKHLSTIIVNFIITSVVGLIILLITSVLLLDLTDTPIVLYLTIFGFLNIFLGGTIHLFIYTPILSLKQFSPSEIDKETNQIFLPLLTLIFAFFLPLFLLSFMGSRSSELIIILTGACSMYTAQSIGAVLLSNKLKTQTNATNNEIL